MSVPSPVASDLGSVDRKLEWADQHIKELNGRSAFFRETKAHEVVVKADPSAPGRQALFLKVNEPAATEMLNEIALRVGDIAHNLRSALDHLAFRAVAIPARIEDVAFPIWRKPATPTRPQYKALVHGKVKGASYALVQHFLSLEPYYGGKDEPIRTIDELDIVDKHRLAIPVAGSNQAVALNLGAMLRASSTDNDWLRHTPDAWINIRPADRYPLKHGDMLFGGIEETTVQMNPQPRIEIVLTEPRTVKGEPVVPALTQLAQYARDVIDGFRPLF